MGLKPFINVKCPCCSSVLEIDVATERVTAHRKGLHLTQDRRPGEDVMDVAIRNAKQNDDRARDLFESAQDKLKSEKDALDRMFRDARKKVADTPPDDET